MHITERFYGRSSTDLFTPLVPTKPAAGEPGSYSEQWDVLGIFLDDPTRAYDRDGAWQMARKLVLPHARRRAS